MIEVSGLDLKTGFSLDYASSTVVCGDYDVIVVGGGIAGVAAAVSAARSGAHTAVIEPRNFVGGNAAMGLQLLGGHTITGLRSAAGLAEEFLRRLKFYGGATDMVPDSRVCSIAPVEPGWAKIVSFQMLDNAGVDLHFHSAVSHLLMDGNRVRGIVVKGRRAYTARTVVDTSGDAVIAAMAGAPFEIGTGNDGWAQPSTLMVRVGAVDTERARREIVERDLQVIHREFLEAHNIDYRRMAPWIGPHYNCNAFVEEVTQAKNDGVLPPNMTQERLIFTTLPAPGEVFLLQAKVVGRNAADDIEKSTAQSEATRMLPPLMRFLREYIPGFDRVHLIDIAPQIGVRETRRIIADHVLTEDEILNDRRFSDTIGLGGYYPDVHPPKGEDKTLASMVYPLRPYEIPFRILVPQGVEGVIVAGRCVSATQRAFGAIRVIPTCMVMGQAAGTAAALAARNSRSFHDLDIPDLQARLAESGAFLHPEDADNRFEFAPLGPS